MSEGTGGKIASGILVAVVVGIVLYQQTKLSELSGEVKVLQKDMERVLTERAAKPVDIDLLSSGVSCKSEGFADTRLEQGTDGAWHLSANLQKANSAAEVFCDLRSADLPGFERHDDDKSVNLAGSTLFVLVQSDTDFTGDSTHPNGIQLLVKDVRGTPDSGRWVDASSSWIRGRPVSFRIARSESSERAAAFSIRFVTGSDSTATYAGGFTIREMRLRS